MADYKYSKEELDAWVPKVQETSKSVRKKFTAFLIITITVMPQRIVFNRKKHWFINRKSEKAKDKYKG